MAGWTKKKKEDRLGPQCKREFLQERVTGGQERVTKDGLNASHMMLPVPTMYIWRILGVQV